MTTNAGAAELAGAAYGFTRTKREGDDQEAISRMFTPEFRNRLDATIGFGHLTPEIVRQVVQKFVLQLEAQLAERQINIELSDAAAAFLAERGYDEQMGARPLSRVIQEHVKKPLADEVLFGRLANGGTVRVMVEKGEDGEDRIGFTYLTRAEERALPKPAEVKALPGKDPASQEEQTAQEARAGVDSFLLNQILGLEAVHKCEKTLFSWISG